MAYIKELAQFEGKEVELKGWNAQKRDSKGLVFMTMRDGTGFVQCIINVEIVGNDAFEAAKRKFNDVLVKKKNVELHLKSIGSEHTITHKF